MALNFTILDVSHLILFMNSLRSHLPLTKSVKELHIWYSLLKKGHQVAGGEKQEHHSQSPTACVQEAHSTSARECAWITGSSLHLGVPHNSRFYTLL